MTNELENFLSVLFAKVIETYGGFIEVRCIKPGETAQCFFYKSIAELMTHVDEFTKLNEQGFNIYMGVLPRTREQGTKDAISYITCLWADLDKKKLGDKENILDTLGQFPIRPSMVLDSGNGCHAYWLLEEPVLLPDEAAQKSAEAILLGVQKWLISDHVQDVSRILRLPGFKNVKKPEEPLPVVLLDEYFNPDFRYKLSDFEEYRDVEPIHITTEVEKVKLNKATLAEPISEELQERYEKLLYTDPYFYDVWFGNAKMPSDNSRSGFDMATAQCLRNSGFTEDETASLMTIAPSGKNKDASKAYLEHTISKIHVSKNPRRRLQIIPITQLDARPVAREDWLIEHILPKNARVILSGMSGVYKSTLALYIAQCLGTKSKFLGMYDVIEPCETVYVDVENNKRLIGIRRFQVGAHSPGIHVVCEQQFKIEDKWPIEQLVHFCKLRGVKLVIIDPLGAAHNQIENDAWSMRKVFDGLLPLISAGITAMVVHHHTKDKRADMRNNLRGSSVIRDAVDTHLLIEQDEYSNELILNIEKMKIDIPLPPVRILVEKFTDKSIAFVHKGDYERKQVRKAEEARQDILATIQNAAAVGKLPLALSPLIESFKGTYGESMVRQIARNLNGHQLSDTLRVKVFNDINDSNRTKLDLETVPKSDPEPTPELEF